MVWVVCKQVLITYTLPRGNINELILGMEGGWEFWELHNSRLREFGYSQNSLNFSPKNIIALGYNFRNWFAWVPDSRLNDSLSYARITSHFFSGSWRCRFPGCLSESTGAWTDNPNPIFVKKTKSSTNLQFISDHFSLAFFDGIVKKTPGRLPVAENQNMKWRSFSSIIITKFFISRKRSRTSI